METITEPLAAAPMTAAWLALQSPPAATVTAPSLEYTCTSPPVDEIDREIVHAKALVFAPQLIVTPAGPRMSDPVLQRASKNEVIRQAAQTNEFREATDALN